MGKTSSKHSKSKEIQTAPLKVHYLPYQYGSAYVDYEDYIRYYIETNMLHIQSDLIGHINSESGGSLFARKRRKEITNEIDGLIISSWNYFGPDTIRFELMELPYRSNTPVLIFIGRKQVPFYDIYFTEGSTEEIEAAKQYLSLTSTPSKDDVYNRFAKELESVQLPWKLFIFDMSINEVLEEGLTWFRQQLALSHNVNIKYLLKDNTNN